MSKTEQTSPRSPARQRPGGRSARVRGQIFQAALEEVTATGLAGLTIPAIAKRANIHPTTLYRRWPDAEAIALDAILDRSETHVAIPDTGSLAADLQRFLSDLDAYVRSPLGKALLALQLSAGGRTAELRAGFWQARFAAAAQMIERARARGELPAGVAARPLLETAIAPVYLYSAVLGEDFGGERLAAHVRQTIRRAQEG